MFEFEVDHDTGPLADIPEAARARFAESLGTVTALSLLPWEEHCTECAMPQCYSSCDLYQSRKYGKCRRFVNGFERVSGDAGPFGPLARVAFKHWGTVTAYGNLNLVPVPVARRAMSGVSLLERFAARLPDARIAIAGRTGVSSRLVRRVKQGVARSPYLRGAFADAQPDCLLIEIYNPGDEAVNLSVVIRDEGPLASQPFQALITLPPGFTRQRFPFAEIAPHIEVSRRFVMSLIPNLSGVQSEGLALYFGLLAFVVERLDGAVTARPYAPGVPAPGEKHVKAVAWDLDKTVWDGILLEDGEEKLALRPGVLKVMQELDRRGIINSVVSKNDPDGVVPLLKRFGIEDYLVFPQVGWNPKSESVAGLIQALNVGADTVVVIDDSPFERSEIAQRCPGVRVYPETEVLAILDKPEFRPPLSIESAQRRQFYQAEERRTAVATVARGSYEDFLRDCQMVMQVQRVGPEQATRVHELIQRTNQLNFSGNRYSRDDVQAFLGHPAWVPISISCRDRFGDYGLVGFCLLDSQSNTVTDLMFSCRVQAKGVEHAFLRRLGEALRGRGGSALSARYRRTAKNAQAAGVFDDLGFVGVESSDAEGTVLYRVDLAALAAPGDIITVDWSVGL